MDEPQVTITVGFSSSLSSGLQRGRELINRPCTAQHRAGSERAESAGLFLSGAFGGCGGGLSQKGPGQEGAGADFLGAVPVSRAVLVQGWGLWHAAAWVSDSGAASAGSAGGRQWPALWPKGEIPAGAEDTTASLDPGNNGRCSWS